MKIILLGAPGSGKGTQAKFISQHLGIPHISTGDIFRDNIKRKTELGLKIKAIIDAGDLAPDELTIEIVKDRVSKEDCKNGYLLDGFPRNLFQAKSLDASCPPDKVIELDLPLDMIERRLTGRRNCAKCNASFHIDEIGDISDCPFCGGEIVTRDDDNIESVKERLQVYVSQTQPLIDYYTKQNKLYRIKADLTVKEVFENIKKVL